MASYFKNFPNVYVAEGVTSDEGYNYRLVKNIFRRVKARDDLDQYSSLFEAYSVQPGDTPSKLAQQLYQDPHLDWVILLCNNITDVYEQWPKQENELQDYVNTKYSDADGVHHYETNEIKLDNGEVFIKEGQYVTETWRTVMPDGTTKTAEESRYPVSNYEYETYVNEEKRLIVLPQPTMVDLMRDEFQDLIEYQPHSELDRSGNKKTVLNIAGRFLQNLSTIPTLGSGRAAVASSFDNGPTSAGITTGTVSTVSASSGGVSASPTPTPTPTPAPSPSPSPSPTPSDSGGGGGGGGGYGGGY